jgi:hypothetical protein
VQGSSAGSGGGTSSWRSMESRCCAARTWCWYTHTHTHTHKHTHTHTYTHTHIHTHTHTHTHTQTHRRNTHRRYKVVKWGTPWIWLYSDRLPRTRPGSAFRSSCAWGPRDAHSQRCSDYTAATLLSHCCHVVVTLCCHSVIYAVLTWLLHCCYTVAALLLHYCCTIRCSGCSRWPGGS